MALLTQAPMAFGQRAEVEGLSPLSPEERVDTLNEWAWTEASNAPVRARFFARAALKESKSTGYAKGEGDAHNRLGRIAKTKGDYAIALKNYQAALVIRESIKDLKGSAGILRNMGNLHNENQDHRMARDAFQKALGMDRSIGEEGGLFKIFNGLGIAWEGEGNPDSTLFYYQAAMEVALATKNEGNLAELQINLGSFYYHQNEYDKAVQVLKPCIAFYHETQDTTNWIDGVNNLALVYTALGKPAFALDSLLLPALASLESGAKPQRHALLYNAAEAFQAMGQSDSAMVYFRRYDEVKDSLYNENKSNAIAELNALYELKELNELDQQNALLRSDSRRKNTLLTALAVIAALLFLLGNRIYWASRRRLRLQRQLNARREALSAQRIVELVQGQELRSLDALLEGQENERQRIASDLHDRLGGLMATVKLHFNAMEPSIQVEQEAHFQQAGQLIDQTCSELRNISHDLAEGQVAAFGLLNSIRDLADSISGAGTLQVRVYDENLLGNLSLALERDLYKITQELLTNVIKHAHATAVTVQLIRHAEYLHLSVEDDGQGMEPATNDGAGLGLRSIQGRVKAHGGTLHVDSHPGAGTTILIDIPLKP